MFKKTVLVSFLILSVIPNISQAQDECEECFYQGAGGAVILCIWCLICAPQNPNPLVSTSTIKKQAPCVNQMGGNNLDGNKKDN